MRNIYRSERLSAATGLGLWAEGVLLALDRTTRLHADSDADRRILEEAAEILETARGQSERPREAAPAAKALAATDTALDIAESLVDDPSPEKTQERLSAVAIVLRGAASQKESVAKLEIEPAIEFFSAIGRSQLAEGNRVGGANGGLKPWTATSMTSSFS